MKRAGRIVLYIFGAIIALALIVAVIGLMLPSDHVAVVEGRYRASAADLYGAISDVSAGPSWRTGLQKAEILSRPGEPLRWRETADWGTLTMVQEAGDPGRRFVSRIADEDQGFGGTWTYDITADANGAIVRITENGVVSNPMFRFMSRFIFGHYSGLETYVRDLGRRFGEDVTPARVDAAG